MNKLISKYIELNDLLFESETSSDITASKKFFTLKEDRDSSLFFILSFFNVIISGLVYIFFIQDVSFFTDDTDNAVSFFTYLYSLKYTLLISFFVEFLIVYILNPYIKMKKEYLLIVLLAFFFVSVLIFFSWAGVLFSLIISIEVWFFSFLKAQSKIKALSKTEIESSKKITHIKKEISNLTNLIVYDNDAIDCLIHFHFKGDHKKYQKTLTNKIRHLIDKKTSDNDYLKNYLENPSIQNKNILND